MESTYLYGIREKLHKLYDDKVSNITKGEVLELLKEGNNLGYGACVRFTGKVGNGNNNDVLIKVDNKTAKLILSMLEVSLNEQIKECEEELKKVSFEFYKEANGDENIKVD